MEKVEKCPSCIDEKLIQMASAIGALVCPSCDLVVIQKHEEVEIALPPEAA